MSTCPPPAFASINNDWLAAPGGALAESVPDRAVRVTRNWMLFTIAIWFAVIILRRIDIGGSWAPVDGATWLLIGIGLVSSSVGFSIVLGRLRSRPLERTATPDQTTWTRIMVGLACVSIVGALLITFDFVVLRGYGFSASAAAIRDEETAAYVAGVGRSSWVSGLGRLLLPAIMPAIVMFISGQGKTGFTTKLIAAVTVVILLFEQTVIEGGRFLTASGVLIGLIAYFTRQRPVDYAAGPRLRLLRVVIIGILATLLFSFFIYVFVERLLARNDFFWTAYIVFASNFDIAIDYSSASRFDGPLGPIWYSLSMLWIYMTQGINELDLLLSVTYFNHAYGLYQVPHIGLIALILFGIDIRYDMLTNLTTFGSYSTFYGHAYVDFGFIGAIVLGALISTVAARAMAGFAGGRHDWLALQGPILLTICLFAPIVSLVPNLWAALVWAAAAGVAVRRPTTV